MRDRGGRRLFAHAPARAAGALAAIAVLGASAPVHAGSPPTFADRGDEDARESDRVLCVLLDPLAVSMGMYGAEVDFVIGRSTALAFEGAVFQGANAVSTATGAGLLLFPLAPALHGLYLEPRLVYTRPLSDGLARFNWVDDALGLGVTAGWQWTWDYGFSVRVGGGAMYFLGGPASQAPAPLALAGEWVFDGSIGWAF